MQLVLRTLTAVCLFGAVSAEAKDFPVSDQDQANIAAICEIASMSPLVENRAQVVGIVKFCIEWKSRVAQAAASATEPAR